MIEIKLPRMRPRSLLAISAYWFATNAHWGALIIIIIPSQIAVIAGANQAVALSTVVGVGALVALVMPPIVGAFSDRCTSRWGRRRPFMAVGVAINCIGLAMMWSAGNAKDFWLYFAAYLVIQFGNNIATASYSGVIPDIVPKVQHGEASGYMAAMTQSGTVLGTFFSGRLMGQGHETASYIMITVTLMVFLGITLFGVREKPLSRPVEPVRLKTLLKGLWIDPRKHPDFAWVWITRALVTMGMWTVQPFILYYLRDVVRVPNPKEQAGMVLGVALIGATITGLLGGRLSDRIGRKRVVYVSNAIIAVTAVGFLFSHSLAFTYVVAIIYGLGFGAYYSVDWALGCDVLPNKEDAAKDLGIWHIAMVLPQSLAPFIAGPLLQTFGSTGTEGQYSLTGYTIIFCLAAFFLILGAVLLRNVKGAR